LIVPSGALASLPFHVLVTEKPSKAFPPDGDYRGVAWLGRRNAISVLPSVTSLKALREHARRGDAAQKAFLGVGNPLLVGPGGGDQSASKKQSCPNESPVLSQKVAARSTIGGDAGRLFRGGLANTALLKKQQPLPETADELCAIGRSLNAPSTDILLGSKATERTIKSLNSAGSLANYRVLHFATHGLLPKETASVAAGLAEASLLLTPPDQASEEDDGLLTASEVTQLKLNADWVILSACNTGGGDQSGEALSGLARAFFYAGARALLVSHWYVDSQSAVALTTKAFEQMQRDPKLGRAESLRRSMRALMDGDARVAHPANWAPFVVVGEGAAR
jgi:CHAT domain-containing protein